MPYIQRHMGGLADSGGSLGMAVKKKHANQAQRVKMLKEQKRAQVTALLTALLTAPFGSLTPESRQTPAGLGVGHSRRVTHGGSLAVERRERASESRWRADTEPLESRWLAVARGGAVSERVRQWVTHLRLSNGCPTALQRLSKALTALQRLSNGSLSVSRRRSATTPSTLSNGSPTAL
jgi:hypothetical protein